MAACCQGLWLPVGEPPEVGVCPTSADRFPHSGSVRRETQGSSGSRLTGGLARVAFSFRSDCPVFFLSMRCLHSSLHPRRVHDAEQL